MYNIKKTLMPLLWENTGIISDNCGHSHPEGFEGSRKLMKTEVENFFY